jgi:hypothetical protein
MTAGDARADSPILDVIGQQHQLSVAEHIGKTFVVKNEFAFFGGVPRASLIMMNLFQVSPFTQFGWPQPAGTAPGLVA